MTPRTRLGAAMHPIVPNFQLGATNRVDDGIRFTSAMSPGATATVEVTVTATDRSPGRLNAWVDFSGNGGFESNEKIFHDVRLTEGIHKDLTFTVPATAVQGLTHARFRYGYMRELGPNTADFAGEVEDYEARILGATPDAVDDQYTVPQNSTSNRLSVLTNDIPSQNGPITIVSTTTPNQGGRVLITTRWHRAELLAAAQVLRHRNLLVHDHRSSGDHRYGGGHGHGIARFREPHRGR